MTGTLGSFIFMKGSGKHGQSTQNPDTQAILALHAKGWSARRIARELKVDRETVGRQIRLRRGADSKPANAPTGSGGLSADAETAEQNQQDQGG